MKRISLLLMLFFTHAAAAETINLTCFDDIQGKKVAHNYTIVSGSNSSNGKVFIDDKEVNASSDKWIDKITSVNITQSIISYEEHYYSLPETIGNKTWGAGTVDRKVTIFRVSGLKRTEQNIQGGMMGEAMGNGTTYETSQCEPRRANRF